MKFTSTFFVSLLSLSVAKAVQVFPGFLSSEDVERYRQEAARNKSPGAATGPSGYRRKLSPVTLDGELCNMIRTALGQDEESIADPIETMQAHVTTFRGSSKSHADYYQVRLSSGVPVLTLCSLSECSIKPWNFSRFTF